MQIVTNEIAGKASPVIHMLALTKNTITILISGHEYATLNSTSQIIKLATYITLDCAVLFYCSMTMGSINKTFIAPPMCYTFSITFMTPNQASHLLTTCNNFVLIT